MKIKASLVSLCFFLFSIYTNSLLSAASAHRYPPAVLDSEGNALRPGVEYYATYFLIIDGGGVGLASTGNDTCPLSVIKLRSPYNWPWSVDIDNGLPLTFHLVESNDVVIREGAILNIKVEEANTSCPESTVWKVDEDSVQGFITTGGELGSRLNQFGIEKYANFGYSFVYCHPFNFLCSQVQRFVENGVERLALRSSAEENFPFVVVFGKKSSVIQLPK